MLIPAKTARELGFKVEGKGAFADVPYGTLAGRIMDNTVNSVFDQWLQWVRRERQRDVFSRPSNEQVQAASRHGAAE